MKRGNLFVLIVVIAAALGIAAAASVMHNGLSARAKPTHIEAMLAHSARRMAIPSGAQGTQNPVPASAENMRDARLHFADHCATCHANNGSGDTMIGQGLYPKPPDLRLQGTQKLSDGELFWIIENGVRFTGMPAFGGHQGTQEDSWKLVHLIRHLPQLTVEERAEMERYNPKGPEDREEEQEEEQEEEDFLRGAPSQPKAEPAHPHR
jgi:mono/diheme cytochrome c family protein